MWEFYLYASPVSFPLNFAIHTWIVTATPNQLTNKYEIHFLKNKKSKNYLYINHGAPNEGMGKRIWNHGPKYPGKLLYHTRGEKESLAQKIVEFVEDNIDQYPHLQTYHSFPGPNSNSFTQWILNTFPEIDISLPPNAFGKKYPIASSSHLYYHRYNPICNQKKTL